MPRSATPRRHRDKWRIRWIDENGKRRSEVFDDYDDALFRLREYQTEVAQMRRGLRPLRAPDKTVGDLCDHWLATRNLEKRNPGDDISIIKVHIRPALGHLFIRDLNNSHISKFKADRAHLSRVTRNNLLTLLVAMLREAHEELQWITRVPKIRKYKVPRVPVNFSYLKTEGEIRRFLAAAREMNEQLHAIYATAIYSGMRQGEIAMLEADDVDFDRRLITVSRSFNGPPKNGEPRVVPLLTPLLGVLRAEVLKSPCTLVFPNSRNRPHGKSARVFQEKLNLVLKDAGFPHRVPGSGERGYIVFHDLRHTFASHWMMSGGNIFKLKNILGHQSIEMTERYSHLAPGAYADDLDRLGTGIPEVGEVLELDPGSGSIGARISAVSAPGGHRY